MNVRGAPNSRDALIVATGSYQDPDLSRLRAPANDAEALARVLVDPDVGGFKVRLLLDQPGRVIRRESHRFFANRALDDLLLVYLSCYVVKDDDGRLYFAATDTEKKALASTAVPASFFNELMDKCRARSVILFLDCCSSGTFLPGARGDRGVHLKERLEGEARVILTASNAPEYSWEREDLLGDGAPSVFTDAIVKGLESGEADRDRDGMVSIHDLYTHVYERVRAERPGQPPEMWAVGIEHDLFVARSPHPIVAERASLPSEDRAALEQHERAAAEDRAALEQHERAAAEDRAALEKSERAATSSPSPAAPPPSRSHSWIEALGGLFRRRRREAEPETSRYPRHHGSATNGEESRSVAADPPRHAYARLDCPDVVTATEEFELTVGLSERPSPDVVGDELTRPPSSVGPYLLAVQVVADGFELREAESWRVMLAVTAEAPYPSQTLHLTAVPGPEPIRARAIRAIFSVDAQTIGMAFRSLVVARDPSLVPEAATESQEADIDLSIPTAWTAPDLTVRILRAESESDGRLLWTFETPHDGVPLPDDPVGSDIGDDPRAFARQLIDKVNAREGRSGLYQYLIGVGRTIADEMPEPIWEALRGVATAVGARVPTLLILSEEPHVPWELAVVDPPLDAEAPPFLSAQVEVGRWVLGRKRPPMPPPNEAAVGAMAVISGVYDRPGWARLLEAEEEAARLGASFGAVHVNAAAADVLGCLSGTPKADLLHFAVHGIYDPTGIQDGLVLVDGHALDPMEVKGSQFVTRPFVFLNACQVGSGNKVLGDYAGMAEAFLWSGASGVVAPLWSVKDSIAKDIALRFYDRIFRGARVGAVLRNERAAFSSSGESPSATYLAYQYFGHPAMKFSRTG